MTHSVSATDTYTVVDIEKVVRRFTADIVMIAQSSGALSEALAREYAHDVEALAKAEYLSSVDLTLFANGVEIKAAKYLVDTDAGDLSMSRPGGVLWPRVWNSTFRIVLGYTSSYGSSEREAMTRKLKINWVPTFADVSHATLSRAGGRDYASNGWGMPRSDYTR